MPHSPKKISVLQKLDHAQRYRLVLIIAAQNSEATRELQIWSQSQINARKPPPLRVNLSTEDDHPIILLNKWLPIFLDWDPNILNQIDLPLVSIEYPADKITTGTPSNLSFSPAIESLLTKFINQLIPLKGDRFLILDNYHVIHDSNIHRMIEYLIDYLPPNFHLIITSHVYPELQIARTRARRAMLEIIPEDVN